IKILEACAAGKPIVSTAVGAEGLDMKPGIEIILADEAKQFANAVIRLMKDRPLQASLGRLARAKVAEFYNQRIAEGMVRTAIASLFRGTEIATNGAIQ